MDTRFSAYNSHLYGLDKYWELDNHLRSLKEQPYIYHHPLIKELPRDIPGIYTLGGGRQIGKTTLLKQWIASLLEFNIKAESIAFYTGELIDDHHALVDLLQAFTNSQSSQENLYIIIDEITYVKDWDKGIKFAADAGYLRNCMVILTGSDLNLMQSARMTFPGRRGRADKIDFHIYPLSFKEYLKLCQALPDLENLLVSSNELEDKQLDIIYREFNNYLAHGGYLTAINDIARDGVIAPATLKIYADWIRGDMLKRGKQEAYLKEILSAIMTSYTKQVGWTTLADHISIDSHKTVADYCELLATMDALFIQSAIMEDKLTAAPKKARKLTFTDPFIYHAVKQWLDPVIQPYTRIQSDIEDSLISSDLVEAVVSSQFRRYYPTYYIKAEGEIDVAYVALNKFWPIEVKWRNQLRPKDLKQIAKYKNARIYSKSYHTGLIDGIPIEPLPLALLKADLS
jgi:predicted AAA+ superfamily ATPase